MEGEAINFYLLIMVSHIKIINMTVLHLDFGTKKYTPKQENLFLLKL